MTQFKVPPRRVKSDDCLLYLNRVISEDGKKVTNGEGIAIHAGEWVDVVPVQSMRELISMGRIASQVSSETEDVDRVSKSGEALHALCAALAARITAWNWTDNSGAPLPQPYKQADVLADLSNDELMYLVQASRGETPEERKKDSAPLASTS